MLIQVTAYEFLDGLQVQVTTAQANESGMGWEHRILEHVAIPYDNAEPWDLIWFVGQLLSERALERTGSKPTAGG